MNNYVDFCSQHDDVIRYLKGETITVPETRNGWCIVCVDGYTIGWAKMQKGRLKNKYPVNWKWE